MINPKYNAVKIREDSRTNKFIITDVDGHTIKSYGKLDTAKKYAFNMADKVYIDDQGLHEIKHKCDYSGCKNSATYTQTTTSPLPNNKTLTQITYICDKHATENNKNQVTTHGQIFGIPFTTISKRIE